MMMMNQLRRSLVRQPAAEQPSTKATVGAKSLLPHMDTRCTYLTPSLLEEEAWLALLTPLNRYSMECYPTRMMSLHQLCPVSSPAPAHAERSSGLCPGISSEAMKQHSQIYLESQDETLVE